MAKTTNEIKHTSQVVTYASIGGCALDVCTACEKRLGDGRNNPWPKDPRGYEYASVSMGEHDGECGVGADPAIYGVHSVLAQNPHGQTTWFATKEDRDAFLAKLRADHVKAGLAEGRAKRAIVAVRGQRSDLSGNDVEEMDAEGSVRVEETA